MGFKKIEFTLHECTRKTIMHSSLSDSCVIVFQLVTQKHAHQLTHTYIMLVVTTGRFIMVNNRDHDVSEVLFYGPMGGTSPNKTFSKLLFFFFAI